MPTRICLPTLCEYTLGCQPGAIRHRRGGKGRVGCSHDLHSNLLQRKAAEVKNETKLWCDMSLLEKSEHCMQLAYKVGPGFCRDQNLAQAAVLRLKHEQEMDSK